MKHLIGGRFETQEDANRAYEALRSAEFTTDEINLFVHKPRRSTARSTDVQIQEIARNAFRGGLIGAAVGAVIGLLVGTGVLSHPYLEPGIAPRDPLFVMVSIVWGLIPGGLIGVILGVATKLLRSREKAEVMTRQIEARGVLVIASAGDLPREDRARQILERHGALEVGHPAESWDLDAWSSLNETSPSLRNLAEAR